MRKIVAVPMNVGVWSTESDGGYVNLERYDIFIATGMNEQPIALVTPCLNLNGTDTHLMGYWARPASQQGGNGIALTIVVRKMDPAGAIFAFPSANGTISFVIDIDGWDGNANFAAPA